MWFFFLSFALLVFSAFSGDLEQLKKAVESKELITLEELIKKDKDIVNQIDNEGQTILYWTLRKGFGVYIDIIKILIQSGADVNKASNNALTPLYMAIMYRHLDVVKLLLDYGADIKKAHCLHYAVLLADTEIVEMLLKYSEDLDQVDEQGKRPLFHAVERQRIDIIKLLISHGANINKSKCLHRALELGHIETIKELLELGADVNQGNWEGQTLLYCAVERKSIDMVRLLLEHGAKINMIENRNYLTPLYLALYHGQTEIVKMFLEYGADLDQFDGEGKTILYWALNLKQIDIVKLLLEYGVDVNKANNREETPLFFAIEKEGFRYTDIVKVLLANGAKTNNLPAIFEFKIKSIDQYNKFLVKTNSLRLELPYFARIKIITKLVSENIQNQDIIKDYYFEIFPEEIWCLIFSYTPNDHLKLMHVSKGFYKAVTRPNIIIRLIATRPLPLSKKIRYLLKRNKEFNKETKIPEAITWQDLEKFAGENNIKF